MEDNIIKFPGKFEELSIICPRCGSSKVSIVVNEKGYFEVVECHKCSFKKED